jgi:ADP-ribosylation factor protein 1
MGFSWSSLFNLWREEEVRFVMIGLDAAGKTTVLNRLKFGEVSVTVPTIGFSVESITYKNIKMNLFDVGGQQVLRKLWNHYYEGCRGVIFVVDSADRARLAEAASELHGVLLAEELRDATLLVLANKQDLPNPASVSDVQEALKLRDVRGRKFFVQGCSATTGTGLFQGLDWLAANLPPAKPAS